MLEEFQSASRWRCFLYEKQCDLQVKCYTSILCLQDFANSHITTSILAFPRLKLLLTYNFGIYFKEFDSSPLQEPFATLEKKRTQLHP